jgi:PAS domain S-box-containing protein
MLAIGVIVLAMVGTIALDDVMPSVALRPMAFIFIIALTAVGGYRWGLAGALVAAVAFTAVEQHGGYTPVQASLFWNALVALIGLAVAVLLVEVIRTQTVAAEQARGDLERSREENENLRQMNAAQTALREAERRYRAVGESLPFGIWHLSADGKDLIHMSDSFCEMAGMSKGELFQGGWLARVPQPDRDQFLAEWERRDPDKIFEGEYRFNGADGTQYWILARGVALRDDAGVPIGWVGFSLDITERKRTQERVAFLAELSRVLALSLDPAQTLERTARLTVPRFADWCAVDLLTDAGTIQRALLVHEDATLTAKARPLLAHAPSDPALDYGAPAVIATGTPMIYDRIPLEAVALLDADDPLRPLLDEFGLCAAVIVPLMARGHRIGAMTFVNCRPDHRYDDDDLVFADLIARRVAIAYDNATLYERQCLVADTLQRVSLPERLPEVPGLTIRAHYVPGAREAEIGGDWYDAFYLPDGGLGLSIGDVAGKGLEAASIMNTVRLAIRAAALERLPPGRVLARANNLLLNEKPTMATAIYGVLDPATNKLTFAVAGHPLPLLIGPHEELTVQPVAPALGILQDASFPEQSLTAGPGSLLVLFTDGLIELDHDISAGEARLRAAARAALEENRGDPATFIVSTLVGPEPRDDVAILTVNVAASPLQAIDLTLPAAPASGRLFRQALRRFCAAVGLEDERALMLQVAAGEAMMNAIEHAYGARSGTIRVRGYVDEDDLVIEVIDQGRWRSPRDDGRGRGLQIITGLMRKVDIQRSEDGTIVRLVEPLSPTPA